MEKYLHWNQKVVAFQLRGFPGLAGVTENRARENADKITLLDRKTRYAIRRLAHLFPQVVSRVLCFWVFVLDGVEDMM